MFVANAALRNDALAGMGSHVEIRRVANTPDKRRGFELHIHALRAVLKKPLALGVAGVVALDEVNQLVVFEERPLAGQLPARLG